MRNHSELTLSPSQHCTLRALAAVIVPASEEYTVPGADDPIIFADIVDSMGPDLRAVCDALDELAALSVETFASLDESRQTVVAGAFKTEHGEAAATLSRIILQCYYRDDRVLHSLGLEPRAPFPKGHALEQGDWTLLDPVRSRPKMWRDAP
jgi:hypothetical protein